jgi:hypothetical protein
MSKFLTLSLKMSLLFQHESLNGYREYFHSIVGFFVIENHLLYTTNGLVTQAILDEMWSSSVPKIANALRTHTVGYVYIIFKGNFMVLHHGKLNTRNMFHVYYFSSPTALMRT